MGLWQWVTDCLTGEQVGQENGTRVSTSFSEPAPASNTVAAVMEVSDDEGAHGRWWAPDPGDLLDLPEPQRPDLCTEDRALENLLIMHFDGRNLTLPAMPRVPERVLRMLANPDCSLAEVADEAGKDPVTAATIIRTSNSPLYSGLSKITSIDAAIVRLGANVVRTLMYNLSLRSITFSESRRGSHLAETLWQRALANGMAMRALSRFTNLSGQEAFLIGLLHDVGNIIVLRIANSQRPVMKSSIEPAAFEYLCHESHQEFGELLADSWSLPDRLKHLIRDHHSYPVAHDPYRTERLMLRVANTICSLLGYMAYAPVNLVESRAVQDLGLSHRQDFVAFLEALPDELERSVSEWR